MRPSTKLKQQKIIEVATQLFLEQGYTQTNLDQVIEQCGGSKQTIYSYFGDKRGLLTAVIEHCIENVEAIFTFDHDEKANLEQILVEFGTNFLNTILTPVMVNTYRIMIAESQNDQTLADFFFSRGPARVSNYLVEFLQSHMNKGNLRPSSPHIATEHLLNLLKGDLQQEVLFGRPLPNSDVIKKKAEFAIRCFLHGYQPSEKC